VTWFILLIKCTKLVAASCVMFAFREEHCRVARTYGSAKCVEANVKSSVESQSVSSFQRRVAVLTDWQQPVKTDGFKEA